jgi:DNA polymerase III alpha subunit
MDAKESLDEYGRYLLSSDEAIHMISQGKDIEGCFFLDEPEVLMYNEHCEQILGKEKLNVYEKKEKTFEEFHQQQTQKWNIPWEYKIFDIEKHILGLCESQEEKYRVTHELGLFKKYELLDLLRFMKYFVDTLRRERTVWGVGRGSSVSVYSLYLLKVHRVDSIKYKLDCKEFFKE